MQMTLSLNRRTHLFIKDGRLFFKLYKPSKFSDKKDIEVLGDVTIEDAKRIHQWLGDVIADCNQTQTLSNTKSIDERIAQIKQLLNG
jgi:hypothetical protein